MNNMMIKDLRSVINFCKTDEKKPVYAEIHYADGTLERCRIQSFESYSDGIVLNVNSDVEPKG